MQTKSSISAAALAAALLVTPHVAVAQGLDLGGLGINADVDIGGDSLLDVDAGVNLGGQSGLDVDASVDVGGSDADDSLVDVDLDATSGPDDSASLIDLDIGGDAATGPNGGTLIDLDVLGGGGATGDNDGSGLVTGDIRIGALDSQADRSRALLDLIDSPDLADIDLDAVIDDRRVSIVAAADLLGSDGLADIEAVLRTGGDGRAELLTALAASVELGAILGQQGIAADDVLAIQVGDNGATEVIVLGDAVELAALGDDGDLADLTVARSATADLDLLSGEELAELDVALLPADPAATANVRLLGNGDDLTGLSVDELAAIEVNLLPGGAGDDGGAGSDPDDGSAGGVGGGDDGASDGGSNDGGTGRGPDNGGSAGDDGSNSGGSTGGTGNDTGAGGGNAGNGNTGTGSGTAPVAGTLPATQVGARFGIAALDCDIGVLALASGLDATPQAIAGARSLELVSIEGCQRSLVDAEVDEIRDAIAVNPVISSVLDDARIPLDAVIGATIQAGTLTLFIEPVVS